MDEADALCDRIAIIDKGIIKVLDTPAALKNSLGNEIVEFTFSKGEAEDLNIALDKIKGLNFVKNVSSIDGSGYSASISNGEASIPAIFEALQGLKAKIGSISLKQPTLDDVFLNYTGYEMRENGGGKESSMRSRITMRRIRK
jgi:ABC-2 type transport system ATP-binding protein